MTDVIKRASDSIRDHYADTFRRFGATRFGVDWPKAEDSELRYALLLRAFEGRKISSVLDVGCGLGYLLDAIKRSDRYQHLVPGYSGVDTLQDFVKHAKEQHPGNSFAIGSIESGLIDVSPADLVVINGVLTVKGKASDSDMKDFVEHSLSAMWEKATVGMAFNLMTSAVDYRYDWLYYVDPAEVVSFGMKKFGRRFSVFHDTRLFDVFYVWWKEPQGLWAAPQP